MQQIIIHHTRYTSPTAENGTPTGAKVLVAGSDEPQDMLESPEGEYTSTIDVPDGTSRADLRRVLPHLVANRFPKGSVTKVEGDEAIAKVFREELMGDDDDA